MILHGDCLERLKELPDNSVDAVVCDPPYFLTNSSGSGFMGKEWDSLSVKNAFAESVLRSLLPVWCMGGENSALENANTRIKKKSEGPSIRALCVERSHIGLSPKLSPATFSVLENVITKAEVLALSKELCPSLTTVFESQPESVVYVARNTFTGKCPKTIALSLATQLHRASVGEDLETLSSLMADQKTNGHIEARTGIKSGNQFTSEIVSAAGNVQSIVLAERYNVTTSSHIESQKIIRWIISLRFVRNAMAKFMENPSNIQLLSEKFHLAWLREAIRVLKPGAHLLAFAGTRTYGRLAIAVEDAGFEIRDQICWMHGQGFPKSHNLDGGLGTALKPALEPICMARKPLEKGLTVAENVQKWGTGALNVDASRIGYASEADKRANTEALGRFSSTSGNSGAFMASESIKPNIAATSLGRWPANVILDEQAAAVLDGQSGQSKSNVRQPTGGVLGHHHGQDRKLADVTVRGVSDSGGASRFFYIAKASKSERNAGLEFHDKTLTKHDARPADWENADWKSRGGNHHPTVKPLKLMEYLIRMVTPPTGIVLDPFAGSGSTLVAAKRLGFGYIGIEREAEYVEIANKRLEAV